MTSESRTWWARALGQPQVPQPKVYDPQQGQYAPLPPATTQQVPGPQQYVQNTTATQQYVMQQPQEIDPRLAWQQIPVEERKHALFAFMDKYRGGQAARTDTEPCPECGSNLFFAHRATGGIQPAPLCHNCGYNGRFQQYGAVTPVPGDN